jgi:hypothetical protein
MNIARLDNFGKVVNIEVVDQDWYDQQDDKRLLIKYTDEDSVQIGGIYDFEKKVFITLPPYDSWILNENMQWEAPIEKPTTDGAWVWNEDNQEWEDISELIRNFQNS